MANEYRPYEPPLRHRDWTEGYVEVGNVAIVKTWDAVREGTPNRNPALRAAPCIDPLPIMAIF
jgi:hypothetical protein